MNKTSGLLTVVLLSYQSEKNLEPVCSAVRAKLDSEDIPFEIVIVDDGSTDRSFDIALELQKRDPSIRAYRFSRNFTSPYSQFAGFTLAKGDCAVTLADDLQRPLDNVVELYRTWQKGALIAIGYRRTRNDGFINDLFSNAYYFFMNTTTSVRFPPGGADGFLADREVIDILAKRISHRNTSPIIEVLQLGYDPVFVPFDRPASTRKSRWTLRKKLALARDTFFSASSLPIKLIQIQGLLLIFAATALSVLSVTAAGITSNTGMLASLTPFYSPVVLILLLVNGATLLSLGVLGEYIRRIHDEVRQRPPYLIRKDEGRHE